MRINPKKSMSKAALKAAKKSTVTKASTSAPAAFDHSPEAARRELQLAAQQSAIGEICQRVGIYRERVLKWGADTIWIANEARNIGLMVKEMVDSLPGKQLSLDFWQATSDLFVDQHGQKILPDQLKWFLRAAENIQRELTERDLQVALSYRTQLLLGAGVFELESCRPPGVAHEPPNPFNQFVDLFAKNPLNDVLDKLEHDPHYGPIENWPADRKQRVWLQIEKFDRQYMAAREKLKVESR